MNASLNYGSFIQVVFISLTNRTTIAHRGKQKIVWDIIDYKRAFQKIYMQIRKNNAK